MPILLQVAEKIAAERHARLCFICDIRTADVQANSMEDTEKYVAKDQEAQKVIARFFTPKRIAHIGVATFFVLYFGAGFQNSPSSRRGQA